MTTWEADLPGIVTQPGGRFVGGRALRNVLPTGGVEPEFGLYLTAKPHREKD